MSASPAPTNLADQHPWPAAVVPVFDAAATVEYTSLTRHGAPITVPITPYVRPGSGTLDVSTGLSYPAKAERARRNPKVSLLFADPVGSGLRNPPVVLVQGLATVRDADLQANTDRYVREVLAKTPEAFKGMPAFLMRTLNWYFGRIWIEITPTRMWWWPSRALDTEPGEWVAANASAPASDPAPPGKQPAAWLEPPSDWPALARRALVNLEQRDLSWTGADGYPVSVPVLGVAQTDAGFKLQWGTHVPSTPDGPACLTFHTHPAKFTAQENHTFIGHIESRGSEGELRVDRALADVSLVGNKLTMTLGFLSKGRRLRPRLASEAARRNQAVPQVRLPRAW